ncbi:GntR family transcriptional regulator [Neobacillus kokaensis]|uniref:GntR family transcriptional regulator n=1 Tax=Neobacillus kokaensis TaxID=2759023 RepID=A0ABQ3N6W5_9BACI|nr:GntR family transcriptional regulator [Neobacillus kokaensis]GHH99243.1 GntR family transcriptional regulator [Neobacillus kokaensis]
MDTFQKLQKETTSMAVYKHLYSLIVTGAFQPGEWIRERQIKEMLGVSSTPIREALKMLTQERLLEAVPHHGVRVKHLSTKEIEDIYELRVELEGLAAELAAKRGTHDQFQKMDELLHMIERKMEENSGIQDSEFLKLNNDFHDLIIEVSGNHALKNAVSQIRASIDLIRIISLKNNKGRFDETLRQHRLILYAIKTRDPQLARLRIQEHIWDSVKMMLKAAKESNERIFENKDAIMT